MRDSVRLAVDVGGTFTDVVVMRRDGTVLPKKVLSTPPQFDKAIKRGILAALSENGLEPDQVGEYTHGATVATNAIITRSGAVAGLITTRGFRDVLEFRRMRVPRLYDMDFAKPPPLVPRNLRRESPERTGPSGEVILPLDERRLVLEIRRLIAEGVESIAVCYLHSYANSLHELRTRELVLKEKPGLYVSLSSEVLPESKEYERTSTTVINAYVQPLVSRYFESMQADLTEMRMRTPITVMQSNGGMMSAETARRFPIHIVESGPAAGVIGAHKLASSMGIADAITLDMGGTTAKAAIIEEGAISRSPEYEVGGEFSSGHRLSKGSGYLLRVPSIDIAEVGAGGGSVAWVDQGGALRVGPHSAGATPGPACYDLGGEYPTITDANVHLGLTNPDFLAGGTVRVHRSLADRAIMDHLARPLGLDVTETAWGMRRVANSSLIRALRAVSTERGRDPRRFVLFAFGGMGPVHAVDVADELGISKVVVPPVPGLFSALGLLFAETEHHLIRTHYANMSTVDFRRFGEVVADLLREAQRTLGREGYAEHDRDITVAVDMHYVGQDFALTVPLSQLEFGSVARDQIVNAFHLEHERTYGYRSQSEEVQVTALRCVARGLSEEARVPQHLRVVDRPKLRGSSTRRCFMGPKVGWIQVPVKGRYEMVDVLVQGPVLIEEDNSITVVPPHWAASLDKWSNIVLAPNRRGVG